MPGPAPTHYPQFPQAFLQHARDTLRRKTAPHCLVQRARLALLLDTSHRLGHGEAGDAVGLSAPQVARGRGAGPPGTSPWPTSPGGAERSAFPPLDRAVVKALACEAVAQTEVPLSPHYLSLWHVPCSHLSASRTAASS
jgi:hypothetical protein